MGVASEQEALQQLLQSRDPDSIAQGEQLLISRGEPELWDALFGELRVEPARNDRAHSTQLRRDDLDSFLPWADHALMRVPGWLAQEYAKSTSARLDSLLRLMVHAPPGTHLCEVRQTASLQVAEGRVWLDCALLARVFPKLRALSLFNVVLRNRNALEELDELHQLQLHDPQDVSEKPDRLDTDLPVPLALSATCTRLVLSGRLGHPMPHVQHLVLSPGWSKPEPIAGYPVLESLRVIGDPSVLRTLDAHPRLEEVHVRGLPVVRGKPRTKVRLDWFAKLPRLRTLVIRDVPIDRHTGHALVGHPTLRHIELDSKWRRRLPKRVRRALPLAP